MVAARREKTINDATALLVSQRCARALLHLERALNSPVVTAEVIRQVISARDELQALLDELAQLLPEELEEVSER
jgi:hypothetical protein